MLCQQKFATEAVQLAAMESKLESLPFATVALQGRGLNLLQTTALTRCKRKAFGTMYTAGLLITNF